MTTKETAIKFANWLREVDTQERVCEWFGYTDGDMYDFFCYNVLPGGTKRQTFEM